MIQQVKTYTNSIFFLLITLVVCGFGLLFQPTIQNNYFDVTAQNVLNHGTLRLIEYPDYFSEVVPTEKGFVIVLPPFPIGVSLVGLPFGFGETFLTQLAIGFSAGVLFLLFRHFQLEKWQAMFLTLGYVFSSPLYFFLTQSGYWYTAQVWGVLGAELAWYMWLKKKYLLAGFGLMIALLSRLNLGVLLAFCLFFTLIQRKSYRAIGKLSVGFGLGLLVLFSWNYYRFGSILATGYDRIPGVLNEPWYQYGILHWTYVFENVKKFLWQFDLGGSGIGMFWMQPYLFLLPFSVTRKNSKYLLWGSLQFIFVLLHGNWGFWQFDFRFLMDSLWIFYPVLFVAVTGWKKGLAWFLLGASILLHFGLLPKLLTG